jgi:hypothetical protein
MSTNDSREEFLLHIYDQAHDNINRQFGYVWQSAGLVAAVFGVFAFAEEKHVPLELPTILFVIVAAWYLAHVIDANLWFNRNLLIIANIERTFLLKSDLRNIHHFFEAHRPRNKMLGHLRIQVALVTALDVFVLWWHHTKRIAEPQCVPPWRYSPYAVFCLSALVLVWFWSESKAHYELLRSKSPGPPLKE